MSTGISHNPSIAEQVAPEPPGLAALRMFLANRAAACGLLVLVLVTLVGLFGSWIYPVNPFDMVAAPMQPPDAEFWFGTDYLGRDVFAGVLTGARMTLLIAFSSTALTVVIGFAVGALAGYYGGAIDNLLMRITEFFQVLPNLVFSMVLVSMFTPSAFMIVLAIGSVNWTGLARLTRAEFLKLRGREFVLSARAAGAGDLWLIWRTILPNAAPPLIIAVTLLVGTCILFEAALSFLGLNDPDVMTWGLMIGLSRDFFRDAWWTVTFPGLAIVLTVLAVALVGDGLNDAFNPKLRQR
jgi:peptide/nickel transport system permease protein